jgi:hypothetical protein
LAAKKRIAGGNLLTMRTPHPNGNSRQFLSDIWKLLPAIAALLAEGRPRVHASAFRTSIGPYLFSTAKRETIDIVHASSREFFICKDSGPFGLSKN